MILVDIEGNLLHDDTSERWLGKYLVRQEEDNGIVYAHIIFYNSAPTSPYAEVRRLFYSFLHSGW